MLRPGNVMNAPIFHGRQIQFADNMFTLIGPPGTPSGQNVIAFSASTEKPFITRSAETFIPLDVWDTAALFFISTMPMQTGSKSEPYYFDLQIEWSIPENSKPARYRVKAVAINTKPPTVESPIFSAEIEFSVEPES